jgi:periplasmic protein TonB
MPHDLFGDVVARPPSTRSHRSSVVIFSIVAHAAAIVALVIVPLFAADTLPTPRRVIDYFLQDEILPVVVPPVPHPTTTAHREQPPSSPAVTPGTRPPIDAPNGISPENPSTTGSANVGPGAPSIGVVEGPPSEGLWRTEPPPAPPPQQPIKWHSGIRVPQKIVDVAPVYPPVARAARAQGIVVIETTIDARGNVVAAHVTNSVALLDQAALDAVRQWKFSPTLLNGVPVPIILTVTVRFTLQ